AGTRGPGSDHSASSGIGDGNGPDGTGDDRADGRRALARIPTLQGQFPGHGTSDSGSGTTRRGPDARTSNAAACQVHSSISIRGPDAISAAALEERRSPADAQDPGQLEAAGGPGRSARFCLV